MFMGRVNGINQYKHGISRRYLFLDDEERAYEAAGRNGFREIPVEEAIARVEAPLQEMGETLETRYDSAYIIVRTPHCARLASTCYGFKLCRRMEWRDP
jgi:hypothetical protein